MSSRAVARAIGPATAILVAQQLFFPAPRGVLVRGLVIGLLASLVALGMALVQRSHRILNFAQADLGAVPGLLTVLLVTQSDLPWGLAVVGGAVAALVLGGAVEVGVMRRLAVSSRLVATVATIGVAQILAAAAALLPRLWGERFVTDRLPPPFRTRFTIEPITFDANSVLALFVAPAAIVAVAWFLLRTRAGVAVRAAADDPNRAATLGVPVRRLHLGVWAVAALLAFVATVLRAGILGIPFGTALTLGVLLRALVALVVGGNSLPGVALAAVTLGVLEQGVGWGDWRMLPEPADPTSPLLLDPLLAVVVLLAIVARRRAADDDGQSFGTRIQGWRAPRWVWLPMIAVAMVLPHLLDTDASLRASAVLIYAILGLSVVVLTGWTGQVSLAQVAFFALGAAVAAKATGDGGLDLTVALLLAAGAGGVAATVLGLPAVRLRGLTLAVATLAAALATTSYLLNERFFGWLPEGRIDRPPLLGRVSLDSPTRIFYVSLAALAVALALVSGVRSSRTGRVLVAVRDNERAAAAYGINPLRARLFAFAFSGGLAAFAGGLFVHHQQSFDLSPYAPLQNLAVLAMTVIGGVGSAAGAVLGALYLKGSEWLLPSSWRILATGAGVVLVLVAFPGGLVSIPDAVRVGRRRVVRRERGSGSTAGDEFLSVRGVDAGYGGTQVLFGVDLHAAAGEVIAILGPNGAGKTTLLRAIAGLVHPTAGSITLAGQRIDGRAAHEVAAMGAGLMPGGAAVFPSLTQLENLRMAAWLLKDRDGPRTDLDRLDRLLVRRPSMVDRGAGRAGDLSGGEQQLLGLAMAREARPRLLLIDELSLGLAPAVVAAELPTIVSEWRAGGATVILVEQSAPLALALADRVYVLEKGEIRHHGTSTELQERPEILREVLIDRYSGPAASPPEPSVSPPVLEAVGIHRRFGGVTALDGVTLSVAPGEVVGLVGPNGAGKTTLFDVISGFTRPDGGTVRLRGDDVTGWAPHQRAWAGLGRSFQDARLFPALTVTDTVAVACERWLETRDPVLQALRVPAAVRVESAAAQRAAELLELLDLEQWRNHRIDELSTGVRRLVDLACVLAHRPLVALLDEPSSGIAQSETAELVDTLRRAAAGLGAALVVIEHDLGLVRAVAGRLVVLDRGRVLADGEPGAVLADRAVQQAYLGQVPDAAR